MGEGVKNCIISLDCNFHCVVNKVWIIDTFFSLQGVFGQLTYSLTGDGDATSVFFINPGSGAITLQQSLFFQTSTVYTVIWYFLQNCKYWWFINNPLNDVKFQYAFPCSCEYEFRMVAVQEKKLLALWHWLYRGISNPHVLFKTATLSRWGKIDPLGFPLEDFLQQMLIHP